MKTPRLIVGFFWVAYFSISACYATEHHSGHNMSAGGGGGGEGACLKARLTKFLPANLATVAPGSAFSFWAYNIDNPSHIKVTVKSIPAEITTENTESYLIVKGKLPAELVNTTARINIKVANTKSPKCSAETGWLVKISEN